MKNILYIYNHFDLDFIKILSNKNKVYLLSLNNSFESISNLQNVHLVNDKERFLNKIDSKFFIIEDIINIKLNTYQNLKFVDFLKKIDKKNIIKNYNRIVRLNSNLDNFDLNLNKDIVINLIEYENFFLDNKISHNVFYISHPLQLMINRNDNLEYLLRGMASIAINHIYEIKLNLFNDLILNISDQKIIYSFIEKNLTNKNEVYSFNSEFNIKLSDLIKDISLFFETKVSFKENKSKFSFSVVSCKSDEFKLPRNSKIIYGNYVNHYKNRQNLIFFENRKIKLKIEKNHIKTYFRNIFYLFLKEARIKEFNFMINDIPPSDTS